MTTLNYPGVTAAEVAGLMAELKAEGASVSGEGTAQNPMVGSGDGVTLSAVYEPTTGLLTVAIVKKPFIISSGFISQQIFAHLAKFGYTRSTT